MLIKLINKIIGIRYNKINQKYEYGTFINNKIESLIKKGNGQPIDLMSKNL